MRWRRITFAAMVTATFTVSSCASRDGEYQVIGVETISPCKLVDVPDRVLAAYGNGGYGTSSIEWDGGVRTDDVRKAFSAAAETGDVGMPDDDAVQQARSRIAEAVLDTFSARRSQVTVRTAFGERKTLYELTCRYRAGMRLGDTSFSLELDGGSGQWDVRTTAINEVGRPN